MFPGGAFIDERHRWTVSYGYYDKWSEIAWWDINRIEASLIPLPGSPMASVMSRKGTTDLAMWKEVHDWNEYGLPDALLNHYAVPLPLGIPRLVLMADPPTAYASLVRRDNIRGVTRHMHGGQYGQDTIEGMELFFEHWTKASPLVFCKYEALYDHLKDISEALGVHFRRFPPCRRRKSYPAEDVPKRLLVLRERFESLSSFVVRK